MTIIKKKSSTISFPESTFLCFLMAERMKAPIIMTKITRANLDNRTIPHPVNNCSKLEIKAIPAKRPVIDKIIIPMRAYLEKSGRKDWTYNLCFLQKTSINVRPDAQMEAASK